MVPPHPIIQATPAINSCRVVLHVNAGRGTSRRVPLHPAFLSTGHRQSASVGLPHLRREVMALDLLHQLPEKEVAPSAPRGPWAVPSLAAQPSFLLHPRPTIPNCASTEARSRAAGSIGHSPHGSRHHVVDGGSLEAVEGGGRSHRVSAHVLKEHPVTHVHLGQAAALHNPIQAVTRGAPDAGGVVLLIWFGSLCKDSESRWEALGVARGAAQVGAAQGGTFCSRGLTCAWSYRMQLKEPYTPSLT